MCYLSTILIAVNKEYLNKDESMHTIFSWDVEFLTGLDAVDEQHKQLINMINSGVQLCISNTPIDLTEIQSLKQNLGEYTTFHFQTEQGLMERYAIDDRHVKEHLQSHREFLSTVTSFFSDTEALQKPDKLSSVMEYLIRWLAYHILHTDKRLANQIRSIDQGINSTEAFENESLKEESSSEPLLKALRALFFIVSEKNQSLERANAELEEKVKARTRELEEANIRLRDLSVKDELTGLPNRRYAFESLESMLHIRQRYGTPFSVMYIDVDKFKTINDTLGHDTGDYVLKWVATFLRNGFRSADQVCRLGGDEFLVICPESDEQATLAAARAVLERVHEENRVKAVPFWDVSISIGLSQVLGDGESVESLLKRADEAMYVSKQAGGCRVSVR